MGLEDDLATLRAAVDGDERLDDELRAAIARLADSNDDRALHLLVEAFTWSVYTSWTELKDALSASKHSEASAYVASRFRTWWDDDDTLCISHAAPVLARRGATETLPILREMSDVAADDSIVLRALLVARIALGDVDAMEPARDEFLSGRSHQGTDAYPEHVMELAGAEAFYDTFAPIVRRYQDGETELRDAAATVAFQVTHRPHRYEGAKRVDLPWPERDPRWAELGVEILEQRPRPKLIHYASQLLDVPHPDGHALRESVGLGPKESNPLLDGLPDALLESHRAGGWGLYDALGVTWIEARSVTLADLEALFEAWGERARDVRGFSIRGRRFDTPAFTKLFGWTGLDAFTHFDFAYTPMRANDMLALCASEGMRHATYLNVRSIAAKKPPLAALGKSLRGLRALAIGSGGDYGPQYGLPILMQLADASFDRLELYDFRFERSMAGFGDTKLARELGELRVAGWYRMGDDAAELLRRIANGGGRLRRLELPDCFRNLGTGDWNDPACELATLEAIDLRGGATSDLFPMLAQAWFIPQLSELGLARTWAFQDRLEPMLSIEMPQLKRLSLRSVDALDRGLFERLVHAPLAANLEWLDVGGATDLRTRDESIAPDHVRRAMRAAGWPS